MILIKITFTYIDSTSDNGSYCTKSVADIHDLRSISEKLLILVFYQIIVAVIVKVESQIYSNNMRLD